MRAPPRNRLLLYALGLTLWAAGAGRSPAEPVWLQPSTFIDTSSGAGVGSGSVSTGYEIFRFQAFLNDLVSLDVNVT